MAIIHAQAPKDSFDILNSTLPQLKQAGAHIMTMLNDDVQVTEPHPVYTVSTEAIAGGNFLSKASLISWRYFIVQDEKTVAAAFVHQAEDKLQFSHVNQGRLVEGTVEALLAAEQLEATKHKDFEFRYLEIRPLHFAAVWLHSTEEDIILPFSDYDDVKAHSAQTEAVILGILQQQIEDGFSGTPIG